MFKRAAKTVIIMAVALSLGLHWALLQSVAWAGMFANYAQHTTFREALVKTFDGKNPCRICKLVREGQQSEKTKESVLPLVKVDSLPYAIVFLLEPPTATSLPAAFNEAALPRAESPPTPPPRLA